MKINGKIQAFIAMFLLFVLSGCEEDYIATYVQIGVHEGIPITGNPTYYTIRGNSIVGNTVGIVHEYKDCEIFNIKNWSCRYSDGSGSISFANGQYTGTVWRDDELLTHMEYKIAKCRGWMRYSVLDGLIGCTIAFLEINEP